MIPGPDYMILHRVKLRISIAGREKYVCDQTQKVTKIYGFMIYTFIFMSRANRTLLCVNFVSNFFCCLSIVNFMVGAFNVTCEEVMEAWL